VIQPLLCEVDPFIINSFLNLQMLLGVASMDMNDSGVTKTTKFVGCVDLFRKDFHVLYSARKLTWQSSEKLRINE
jgi:hypothetical protein